jgi:hypothetical protein
VFGGGPAPQASRPSRARRFWPSSLHVTADGGRRTWTWWAVPSPSAVSAPCPLALNFRQSFHRSKSLPSLMQCAASSSRSPDGIAVAEHRADGLPPHGSQSARDYAVLAGKSTLHFLLFLCCSSKNDTST